jgi:hypothetical protein
MLLAGCSSTESAVPGSDAVSTVPRCPQAELPIEEISQERADLLVGMTEWASQLCAESIGWGWRLASRDGESFPLTRDYNSSRVSVSVLDEIVVSVVVG